MWKSSCSIEMLKARSEFYTQIRAFFYARDVLEVETPLLGRSTATDPYLDSVTAKLQHREGQPAETYYLHTSPEFPMKRLLASGSGPIYQICKTFRNGETGCRHNPEFSMLEWYRPDFSLEQLIAEVSELVETVLSSDQKVRGIHFERLTYQEAFQKYLSIDPFSIDDRALAHMAKKLTAYAGPVMARDDYLNLLMSACIEPHLGVGNNQTCATFLCEYPPSQASLAKITRSKTGVSVAQRFELYIQGIELANGYFELVDPIEQKQRFEQDNQERIQLGFEIIPIDKHLISAMQSGLPVCSGVALGLDRLLMIREAVDSISEVIAFPVDRA